MTRYIPLKITGVQGGLVQEREEFLLPDDAYPILKNAYTWREKLLRKKGYRLLGRLRRNIENLSLGNSSGDPWTFNLKDFFDLSLEPNAQLKEGSLRIFIDTVELIDQGNGILETDPPSFVSGLINYSTWQVTITGSLSNLNTTINFSYFPCLPVMGIRTRELTDSSNEETIFFDQVYAYIFDESISAFKEWIPGTTWNESAQDITSIDFFFSTNYWVSSNTLFNSNNIKLFWVTNNTGREGNNADPPRITDGTDWISWYTKPGGVFTPQPWININASEYLVNWLSMLPFRGRMLTFNTWEGQSDAQAINYSNRIRWSTIGNPFIAFDNNMPAKGSWRDDIRGQGGFLDIPTSEDIVGVGFVRDNLVIYCERSTWQLRYTGRSIAPFQIERVNSELGAEGPFSAVQFDTSLVGIGDKGIVECDSYKSKRIDIKIPDYVFNFRNSENGKYRVHGARNFISRLAFWTICNGDNYDSNLGQNNAIFPNQRLIYNYENDSWALFDDSLTTLGTYQPQSSRTWLNTDVAWTDCNFTWLDNEEEGIPAIVGGNQQGFIEYLDVLNTNDPSLFIKNITSRGNLTSIINSPHHNMSTGFVIKIEGILQNDPFYHLNDGVFGIYVLNENEFEIYSYNPSSGIFNIPQLDILGLNYIGSGLIRIRDNFSIVSKKFNFLDEGKNIQLGYLDILMSATSQNDPGAISLHVYIDYDGNKISNITPSNEINDYSPQSNPDTFFNSIIPTYNVSGNTIEGNKFWQRIYCATRASFITLEYTFSNEQLAGTEQEKDVQIDAQILWIRKAGRMTNY